MRRLRNSFLAAALLASASFAQTAEQLESPAVNRVAEKLLCPCGCKMNMACRMEPYPCQTCWANKKKILKLQAAGFSDQAILDQFAQEQGKEVVANPPGMLGSLSMYTAAILGLILVVWMIRRYSHKGALEAAGAPGNDPELDRYHDQIEKEVEKLD
jgi:cytochrome c-type biogenesis protein CcmH/NrfF